MNNDEGQRMNMQNYGMRKPMTGKYPEKSPNYSPSTSYNYSPQTGYNGNSQMFQRRRPPPQDRFRRDQMNPNERLLRQNDIIIRLLKEIRDRLPQLNIGPATEVEPVDAALEAPPASEGWEGEDQAQDGYPIPLKKDEFPHDEGDKNDAGGNTNDSIAP